MGAVLPLHPLIVDQANVSLIDQGRRLERVAWAFALQIAVSQAVEFVINDGGQPFERALISFAPGAQERAYVACLRLARLCRPLHPYGLNYSAARLPLESRLARTAHEVPVWVAVTERAGALRRAARTGVRLCDAIGPPAWSAKRATGAQGRAGASRGR